MKQRKTPKRLPSGGIEYKGKEFSSIDTPRYSTRKNKAHMVLACKDNELKVVHFGTQSSKVLPKNSKKVEAGRKGYLNKTKNIRNKDGTLSKKDKFSPIYWSVNHTN